MIDAGDVARLLRRTPGVDEFTITEVRRVRARRDLGGGGGDQLADTRELRCVLYRDLREGRGAQPVSLGDVDRDGARELLRRAADAAARTHAPPWRLPPPAAPARVHVADTALGDPASAADELAAALSAALPRGARLINGTVEVESVTTEVRDSGGFGNRYLATTARWRASIAAGSGEVVTGDGAARRLPDLDLGNELAALAERAGRRAEPLAPGRCDLVLRLAAIAPLSPTWGWFAAIAHQAGGELSRLGLTRHRSGQSIYPQPPEGDLLDVTSDGTIDYGLLSAPFGDAGEPVRRFPLVRAGRAADLALDRREAGLRSTTPNGGVRNLDVGAGTHADDALLAAGERPLVVVDDLAWLEIDARGRFAAGLGTSAIPGAGARRGGAIAGDVFALFSRARLGTQRARRGWYRGPTLLRFDDVRVF